MEDKYTIKYFLPFEYRKRYRKIVSHCLLEHVHKDEMCIMVE